MDTKSKKQFDYSKVPEEMRAVKQWGLFKLHYNSKKKKNDKLPINPYDGTHGKSNDPTTWSDFDTALNAYKSHKWNADGLAFYLTNGFVGLDIDDIPDDIYKHSQHDPNNLVDKFRKLTNESYMEISQSGKGVHIIFKGKKPGIHCRNGKIEPRAEFYDHGRFFAMTGNAVGFKYDVQTLNDEQMQAIYEQIFGKDKPAKTSTGMSGQVGNNLSEQEIIQKMLAGKNADRDQALINGNWQGRYPSPSEADQALCNDLAFYAAKDAKKMDDIFRQSKLMRAKWDEKRGAQTYGQMTISKAIDGTTEVYGQRPKIDGYFFGFNQPLKPAQDDVLELVSKEKFKREFKKEKKLEKAELNKLVTEHGSSTAKQLSYDDMGMTRRVLNAYPHKFRYSFEDKCFYIYNGSYWEQDKNGTVEKLVDKVVWNLRNEKVNTAGLSKKAAGKKINSFLNFAKKQRSRGKRKDICDDLKHHVDIVHDQWEPDKMLLNVKNGYVDLTSKHKKLYKHDYSKMFIHQAEANFDPNAKCPLWLEFLDQIFCDDKDLIHYVQKALGYSITDSTSEQVLFIALGGGRNGKSVLFNVMQYLTGNYAKVMSSTSIMEKKNPNSSGPTEDIARLEKARIVLSNEINEGERLNESLVKHMTGSETMLARYGYGHNFEFRPTFKLWLAVNHVPKIVSSDKGIWRRVVLIPFNYTVPEDQVDPDLENKLEAEADGILNWLLQGAYMWQCEGLAKPEAIEQANNDYRQEMDVIQAFIADECVVKDGYNVRAKELFNAYKTWADETNSYSGLNPRQFSKRLADHGFNKKRESDAFHYLGIDLKNNHRFKFNK